MSEPSIAVLPDRGVVAVTGPDARKLLGDIITNDVDLLDARPAMLAALLSPQGKVLFEFLVRAGEDGYLLDVARSQAAALAKRLTLYKLRAKVEIRDVSDDFVVHAAWGDLPAAGATSADYRDPRHPDLGWRGFGAVGTVQRGLGNTDAEAHYHAHRIALGVPEGGKDYDFADAFPHEVNFDLLGGVSFDKGCYVGQEIVARMEHRGTVRKRIVRVVAEAELPSSRPDVMMGDVVIGKLGSVAGRQGLAMIRLDRAIEAIDKGQGISAGGIALDIDAQMIARQRKLMAEKAAAP